MSKARMKLLSASFAGIYLARVLQGFSRVENLSYKTLKRISQLSCRFLARL